MTHLLSSSRLIVRIINDRLYFLFFIFYSFLFRIKVSMISQLLLSQTYHMTHDTVTVTKSCGHNRMVKGSEMIML